MRNHALLIATLLISSNAMSQQTAHIADDVYVFTQGGPGSEFRIVGRVRSGEPVTIMSRQNDYIQIRTQSDRVSWVPDDFVVQGPSSLSRLPGLEKALEDSEKLVEEQNQTVQSLNQRLNAITNSNQDHESQVTTLKNRILELENDVANMDESNTISWMTHGGIVAFIGLLIGLMVPYLPKRRKRRDDWL